MNFWSILTTGAGRVRALSLLCLAILAMGSIRPAVADTFFKRQDNNLWGWSPTNGVYQLKGDDGKALPVSVGARPVVYGRYVYYVGPGNHIWRYDTVGLTAKQLGAGTANSTPYVYS
jgi:hypothetical protein